MPTRTLLTLLLILLAAVIAAAAIFFLLARSGPPGDTGAGSPAPPGAEPPASSPQLTLVAESIVDAETGQALTADVYLNDALLYQDVTHFQVTVPMDGSAEIRVAAPGCRILVQVPVTWEVTGT